MKTSYKIIKFKQNQFIITLPLFILQQANINPDIDRISFSLLGDVIQIKKEEKNG